MQLIYDLYVSSTYVTFCVKSRLIDLQTSSSYVEVLVVVNFGEEVVVQAIVQPLVWLGGRVVG